MTARFSGGTVLFDDGRCEPAYRCGALLTSRWEPAPRSYEHLALRAYQAEALAKWESASRRGIVALPTGAGKTRIAMAAILACGVPAVVLAPTRALVRHWEKELTKTLGERIGVVADGESRIERVTVMTFESAYRRLDFFGDRFGLLVVDEVHHFASGLRAEALEACAAVARLGLSATAPEPESEGAHRLADLVGPVVLSLEVEALAGTHLAPFDVVRLPVELEEEERRTYEAESGPFLSARRLYFRHNRFADYNDMLRDFARNETGRQLLRDWAAATRLACFPRAKRSLVASLLARHRSDRTIVFTAHVEDAYAVAEDNLVPAITGEVRARERQRILDGFQAGTLRAIASARVLNEGIDVPDARVAIVASGSLGVREHVQRVGRVLRPAPQKRALIYELITRATVDERIADKRRRRKKGGHDAASV